MFKIGQQVVCVKQHSQGILEVNKIYTVLNIYKCNCGRIAFDVDILNHYNTSTTCDCMKTIEPKTIWWINSKLFRPLEYNIISNKELISNIITEKLDTPIKQPEKIKNK